MPCSVPLEERDKLEQSQEIKLAARSRSYGTLTRVWGAVSDLNERDRQCQNTLGGSDKFELETPPDRY